MDARTTPSRDATILIVGAGTIGLSTALHLTDQGYKNITVIDREIVPSVYSAGNDLNKIVRADYEDHFYAGHALVNSNIELSDFNLMSCKF
jgi:sarcosine oxidase / L-pipecolate oxidase